MRESSTAIAEFWNHVATHYDSLGRIKSSDDEPYLDALASLQKIHAKLYLAVGGQHEEHELIVTAEGDEALFPLVDKIVSKAPRIPGWTILALKPRCGFPEFASWNSVRLEIEKVFFEPLDLTHSNALGIRLLVPDLTDSIAEDARLALIQAMEFALGERAFALEVKYVEANCITGSTDSEIPLIQLEEYIAWRTKRRLRENGS